MYRFPIQKQQGIIQLKKAEEKIKEYQNKKGFENYPNNFKIEKLKIYAPSKASKFYELWHEYMDKNGYDVITPIGVYGTFEEALAMKTKSLFYSKYKEHPNGFEIAEIKLDLDGWTEGFIPIQHLANQSIFNLVNK